MWPAGERAGRRRARGGGSLELSAAPVCPQAVAAQVKPLNDGGGQPPQLSPFPALSPAALSAILTPSGSGFRVDFGAALQVSGAHRKRPKAPHVHNPYLHAQPASAWPDIPQWSPRGQGYWVGVRARGRRGDREGGLVGGWRRRGRGAVCGRALSSAAYLGVGAAAIARRHATAGGGGASGLRPLAASVRRACARPPPPSLTPLPLPVTLGSCPSIRLLYAGQPTMPPCAHLAACLPPTAHDARSSKVEHEETSCCRFFRRPKRRDSRDGGFCFAGCVLGSTKGVSPQPVVRGDLALLFRAAARSRSWRFACTAALGSPHRDRELLRERPARRAPQPVSRASRWRDRARGASRPGQRRVEQRGSPRERGAEQRGAGRSPGEGASLSGSWVLVPAASRTRTPRSTPLGASRGGPQRSPVSLPQLEPLSAIAPLRKLMRARALYALALSSTIDTIAIMR